MAIMLTMRASVSDFVSPDLVAATGMRLAFDLNIRPGHLIRDVGTTLLIDYQRAYGYIRSDGQMYDTPAVSAAPFDLDDPGNLGVRLLANDPAFGLDPGISYTVRFEKDFSGRPEILASFATPVMPAIDTVVYLSSLTPGPGLPVMEVPTLGLVDHLADAGAAGKAVARSATGTEVFEAIGGWPTLGVVPADNLPSYVDDVVEFTDSAAFPEVGEAGKIYFSLATGESYRWSGSAYLMISSAATLQTATARAIAFSIALG